MKLQVLHDFVLACLVNADKHLLSSVAFPALGTGFIGIPAHGAATVLYRSIDEFAKSKTDTTLSDIRFVIYNRETFQSFKRVALNFQKDSQHSEDTDIFVDDLQYSQVHQDIFVDDLQYSQVHQDIFVDDLQYSQVHQEFAAGDTTPSCLKEEDIAVEIEKNGITIRLIQGSVIEQQADVLVICTNPKLNLRQGGLSRNLLKAAGPEIQQECSYMYPDGIQPGQIAVTKGYKLPCKAVYFCALPQLKSTREEDLMNASDMIYQTVQMCLFEADSHGYQSIVFPALGTGYQNIPPQISGVTIFNTLVEYSQSISLKDVRIIVYKDYRRNHILEAFSEVAKDVYEGTLKKQAIPPSTPNTESSAAMLDKATMIELTVGKVKIKLKKGSIVEEKADVLVVSTNCKLDLSDGAMSMVIGKAAGPELQQELNNQYPDGIETGQIAVANGYKLPCKALHFCTLPMLIEPSKDDAIAAGDEIYQTAQMCLLEADSKGYQSIAFPTLGTGSWNIPLAISSRTLMKALADYAVCSSSGSLTDIRIIVYPQVSGWEPAWEAYKSDLKKLSDEVNQLVKDVLKRQLEKQVTEMLNLEPSGPSPTKSDPKTTPRGSREWLQEKYSEEPCSPKYWTKVKGGKNLKKLKFEQDKEGNSPRYFLVDVDKPTEEAVKKIVYASWEQDKVGHGHDAAGLNNLKFSKIKVTKVQRVEHLDLFEKYSYERQQLFSKACKNGRRFSNLQNLKGSVGPVRTEKLADGILMEDIYPEINEFYLFHGTKQGNIDAVLAQGLDNRMAGTNAVFGQGIYAAESATKADQYVDTRSQRSVGEEKQMLMIRMCMGEICLTNKPKKHCRAPCLTCYDDSCKEHNTFSDSVVVDGLWIFREFIVYDQRQSYPEYLITYIRV
ncbi:hypothetical protein KUTeg_023964 [Tegillarca granosa]|uniref:Poly [ADP-ribose] polymerase n=1 Tax=Tegillarca granosa TaxID=220873 RepID=A0ABQ9E2C8_TEGGR|nr:hypothetical protein KUTeg_023964 [Tegillarca granosa]